LLRQAESLRAMPSRTGCCQNISAGSSAIRLHCTQCRQQSCVWWKKPRRHTNPNHCSLAFPCRLKLEDQGTSARNPNHQLSLFSYFRCIQKMPLIMHKKRLMVDSPRPSGTAYRERSPNVLDMMTPLFGSSTHWRRGHWLVQMEWHPAKWSVCLPLLIFPCTIKSRSFSSGTSSPGWSRKKGRKTVMVVLHTKPQTTKFYYYRIGMPTVPVSPELSSACLIPCPRFIRKMSQNLV